MSQHQSAVFNNSCLKVPRNPGSKTPYPVYDQKLMNQLENEARKLSLSSSQVKQANSDKHTLKSFIEFYDSIPEYDDVNHLSNKEFYRRLECLKEKQKSYFDYVQNQIKYENRNTAWLDDYKNLNSGDSKSPKLKQSKNDVDLESVSSLEKDVTPKPPSRRSVRIESPEKDPQDSSPDWAYFRSKSRADMSSAGSKRNKTVSPFNDSVFDDLSDLDVDREDTTRSKSAPSSPRKFVGWKDCGITVPKPFQMTVRDEEDKIVEEMLIKNYKPRDEKPEMFRAHPVPIESQVPLFEKILYDQEIRRYAVKERSKAALQARMRPFSFTKRDEEIQEITRRLSKSSPCLYADRERVEPIKITRFRAKPVPKNLFSNYIYRKMHEDEFYRALQRKIRSEEMLKAASLPPAMARREKHKPKHHICPRSIKYMEIEDEGDVRNKVAKNKNKYYRLDKELAQLELDFILETPSPKPSKGKSKKKGRRSHRKNSADSKSDSRCQSTVESVNRSNLAAVLRIEAARKRMEDEISRRLDEARIRDEARWREKVLRKRPVWQALAYSNEEDLNMRLQLRREEERLRSEEHKMYMQSMLGRVKRQPTLFERQSQARYAKTREELIAKLYGNMGRHSSSSKMSSNDSEQRSVVEMKDEAIQAHFDEIFKSEEKAAVDGTEDGDDLDYKESC